MRKEDQLSYASRQLRRLIKEEDASIRTSHVNEIVINVINELSNRTKYCDLGLNFINLLRSHNQDLEKVVGEKFLSSLPNFSSHFEQHTEFLKATDKDPTNVMNVVNDAFSVFAQGSNKESIRSFISALKTVFVKLSEPKIADVSNKLQPFIECLGSQAAANEEFNSSEVLEALCLAGETLSAALSLFAEGSNAEPIGTLLALHQKRLEILRNKLGQANEHRSNEMQRCIEALMVLKYVEDQRQVVTEVVRTLHDAFSLFAEGDNRKPIQSLLDEFVSLTEDKKLIQRSPDCSKRLMFYINTLATIQNDTEGSEQLLIKASRVLCDALAVFARAPNEESILSILKEFDGILHHVMSSKSTISGQFQCQLDALAGLEGVDDADYVTAAAGHILYDVLDTLAVGDNEAAIRELLEAFDKAAG